MTHPCKSPCFEHKLFTMFSPHNILISVSVSNKEWWIAHRSNKLLT